MRIKMLTSRVREQTGVTNNEKGRVSVNVRSDHRIGVKGREVR